MGMWGLLLWVIECAEYHGHGPVDLRGHWRPLQAAAGREAEAEIFFCQIWACGLCYYELLNMPNVMGMVPLTTEAAGGRWRPRGRSRELFLQLWVCGLCYYELMNAPSRMGMVLTASEYI